jgi:hypothetical protein
MLSLLFPFSVDLSDPASKNLCFYFKHENRGNVGAENIPYKEI